MRKLAILLMALAGCGSPAFGNPDPPPDQPPSPVRMQNPSTVMFQMHRHYDDLREVERLLVSGKLHEGRTRAYLLTRPASDPGLRPYAIEIDRLVDAARQLVAAPDLDTALRREANVALACAECHARSRQTVLFPPPPALPADAPTTAARMARHQWAVDRLWEGLVAGSAQPWRAGLDVLAVTPLPYSPGTLAPKLGRRLQQRARDAIEQLEAQRETLQSRARLYGEMLVTCAGCHSTQGPALAPRKP